MSKSKHYTTAPEDRISIPQKTAYAVGMLVNNIQAAALPAMVVILNLGLGMNPLLVGIIGAAPRIIDAISDPMMGYISDNTRSRFGRRRPYIFGGVILAGIIFALMWQLPNGYINILSKEPIVQHESLLPDKTNVIFQEGGRAIINYDKDQQSESGFVFYGPRSLEVKKESVQAINFSEYSSIEISAEIPEGLSFEVIFNESGAAPVSSEVFNTPAGDDGESFYFEATSKKGKGDVLRFDFKDLKHRTSYGNQNGGKHLDLQAIKNIIVRFPKLQGAGTIKIHSIKLIESGHIDSIDILAQTPISPHESLSPNDATTVFKKGGETVLNYNLNRQSDSSFIFYGPKSLALPSGLAFATNLDGYPQFEVDVDAPKGASFKVFFNEAGVSDTSNKAFNISGGGDGESYYVELTSEKGGRNLYRFNLNDLKRHSEYGNQSGNNRLDMQSMRNISVDFAGLSGSGALTIHSVTLRKSESFFVRYFWYFMSMSVLFFLAYTVYATPFIALGYEMTPDYHERTRLHAAAQWAGQIAWLTVPWFYAIMYSETLFDGPVHGARVLAIVVGIFIAVFGIVPAIFTRERFGSLPKDESRVGLWNNTKNFFRGFAITLKCRPFVKLCAVTFLVFNGFQLGISFSIYVMVFYLFGGDHSAGGKLQGWFGTVSVLGTMIVVLPLLTWFSSKKLGKKETFLITISLALVGYVLKWFGYNPDYPYLLLVSAPIISFGIGSLFTLMGSMVADVCDYDELETGQRREGMFGAIYWWMVKIGMSVAALLTGILLNSSGFDAALGSGQSPKTLLYLRIFDISIPMVTFVIALLIISTYSITEKRAHEIRIELERRRGK